MLTTLMNWCITVTFEAGVSHWGRGKKFDSDSDEKHGFLYPFLAAVVINADMELSSLRPWLDEHEKFAASIAPTDPRFVIARQMLESIAMARDSLRPSADSTANFIHNKEIIEQLVTLRSRADSIFKRAHA